jgi:hypothetical protein
MPSRPVLQDRWDKVRAADVRRTDKTIIDGKTAWRRRYVAQYGDGSRISGATDAPTRYTRPYLGRTGQKKPTQNHGVALPVLPAILF